MRRGVVVAVAAVVMVGVGLDVGARALAERAIANEIQSAEGLAQAPEVGVAGFPFLLQVALGDYRQIDVELPAVTVAAGRLRVDRVHARLFGVRLPVSSLLERRADQVPVDRFTIEGTATYGSLNAAAAKLLPASTGELRFSDGGDGRLRVRGTYRDAGVPVTVDGLAGARIANGRLELSVLPESLAALPGALRSRLAPELTLKVDLDGLPFGMTPTRVTAGADGIMVVAEATDVTLGPGGLSR